VVPLMYHSFAEWAIGFTIAMLVCGLTISIVFQLAHVVPTASFPLPEEESNKIQQNWMIHQLATTVNFATRSRIVSWFAGGLNFQVEHHLFPKISHVHYPQLRLIVKEFCEQRKIPYLENETFFGAIREHVLYLRDIGRA